MTAAFQPATVGKAPDMLLRSGIDVHFVASTGAVDVSALRQLLLLDSMCTSDLMYLQSRRGMQCTRSKIPRQLMFSRYSVFGTERAFLYLEDTSRINHLEPCRKTRLRKGSSWCGSGAIALKHALRPSTTESPNSRVVSEWKKRICQL